MNPPDVENVLAKATVPEHSVAFMEAMSEGKAFLAGFLSFHRRQGLAAGGGLSSLGR